MWLIGTIVIGFLVGLLARFLMPGRDSAGVIVTTLLGIAGSLLASWAGQSLHWYERGQPAGFLASVVGAVVLLALYRLLFRDTA